MLVYWLDMCTDNGITALFEPWENGIKMTLSKGNAIQTYYLDWRKIVIDNQALGNCVYGFVQEHYKEWRRVRL